MPSSGGLPDPGVESVSCLLHRQAGSLPVRPPGKPQHRSVGHLYFKIKLIEKEVRIVATRDGRRRGMKAGKVQTSSYKINK